MVSTMEVRKTPIEFLCLCLALVESIGEASTSPDGPQDGEMAGKALLSEKVIEESSSGTAHVKVSGWGRSEADANTVGGLRKLGRSSDGAQTRASKREGAGGRRRRRNGRKQGETTRGCVRKPM